MSKKPNILYIVTDQQSAHMMSCMGTDWVSTPNLDKIAEKGILFNRAYCGNPVCIPSRFSLFTGFLPEKIGLRSNPHKHLEPCPKNILNNGMGHLFKNAGYTSVYGGKQHFPGYKAEDLGFDVITRDEREELADECCDFLSNEHDKPWLMVASFINPHDICYKGLCDWIKATKDDMGKMDKSIEYKTISKYDLIDETMTKETFFNKICPPLALNHQPQENEPSIIEEFLAQRPFKKYIADNYDINDWRMHRYIYKKLTEEMDKQVGKVLDTLDKSIYKDNTLIVFTSDHGDMDGSHRMEHKTVLYEEAINIPLIIAHPSLEQGKTSDILCSNALDLLPTLLDFAEIEIPSHLHGVDILKAYKDEKYARKFLPVESELGRCIVTKEYKYVSYDFGENAEQLYDYLADPNEMFNHVNNSKNNTILNDLREIFNHQWSKDQLKQNPSPLILGKMNW